RDAKGPNLGCFRAEFTLSTEDSQACGFVWTRDARNCLLLKEPADRPALSSANLAKDVGAVHECSNCIRAAIAEALTHVRIQMTLPNQIFCGTRAAARSEYSRETSMNWNRLIFYWKSLSSKTQSPPNTTSLLDALTL